MVLSEERTVLLELEEKCKESSKRLGEMKEVVNSITENMELFQKIDPTSFVKSLTAPKEQNSLLLPHNSHETLKLSLEKLTSLYQTVTKTKSAMDLIARMDIDEVIKQIEKHSDALHARHDLMLQKEKELSKICGELDESHCA